MRPRQPLLSVLGLLAAEHVRVRVRARARVRVRG